MAHTFAVLDWLLLGCVMALSGGTTSWLLPAVPLLTMGQLAVAPRSDWPYLLAPSLLLLIVLAIADPSLGGNRSRRLLELAVLVAGGVVAAGRLHRAPARRSSAPKVDVVTGLYTTSRLEQVAAEQMAAALQQHQPLGVVYARLEHYEDARNFMGQTGSDELVRGVARRLQRRLGQGRRGVPRAAPTPSSAVVPGASLKTARRDRRRGVARRELAPDRRAPADTGHRRLLVPHRPRSADALLAARVRDARRRPRGRPEAVAHAWPPPRRSERARLTTRSRPTPLRRAALVL